MRCPRLDELPPPPPGKTGWPWTEDSRQLPDVSPAGRPWPQISIVTPSFNQGAFLEETIRSVLLQGYPDSEYIVIDGGSTDGSLDIIRKYERWLSYWSSERDRGPADALNKGFAYANGRIHGYINADDFYLPGALEQVALAFEEDSRVDVVCGHGYFADRESRLGPRIFSDQWDPRRYARGICILVQQSTFWRAEAFRRAGHFNVDNPVCFDGELWVRLWQSGSHFRLHQMFLGVFRMHPSSISGSQRLQARYRAEYLRLFSEIMGRPMGKLDLLWQHVLRVKKFLAHPVRSIAYRRFLRQATKQD